MRMTAWPGPSKHLYIVQNSLSLLSFEWIRVSDKEIKKIYVLLICVRWLDGYCPLPKIRIESVTFGSVSGRAFFSLVSHIWYTYTCMIRAKSMLLMWHESCRSAHYMNVVKCFDSAEAQCLSYFSNLKLITMHVVRKEKKNQFNSLKYFWKHICALGMLATMLTWGCCSIKNHTQLCRIFSDHFQS